MLTHHYSELLHFHNALRWLVLLSGFLLIIGCVVGKLQGLAFKSTGRRLVAFYTSLLNCQFLLGVLLSFASPLVRTFWADPAAGMKSHDLRLFAMEHTTLMIAALALGHIASARSRRAPNDSAAYTTALKWSAASLALILAGIPWWRPLLG